MESWSVGLIQLYPDFTEGVREMRSRGFRISWMVFSMIEVMMERGGLRLSELGQRKVGRCWDRHRLNAG